MTKEEAMNHIEEDGQTTWDTIRYVVMNALMAENDCYNFLLDLKKDESLDSEQKAEIYLDRVTEAFLDRMEFPND